MIPRNLPRPTTPGLVVPVNFVKARDADTIVVKRHSSEAEWAIRLKDVWAPELSTPEGKLGVSFVQSYCYMFKEEPGMLVWVEYPDEDQLNWLKLFSFDRVIGHVWVGPTYLNRHIIEQGFASSTKNGPLGQ